MRTTGLRERLAGPLPPLTSAFALGIGAAQGGPWPPTTALAFGIFPAAALGVFFARRLAPRRALAAFAVAFALAGLTRGLEALASDPGPPPGPGPADGPSRAHAPEADTGASRGPHLGGGTRSTDAPGRSGVPGPDPAAADSRSLAPGPCAAALAAHGLPVPGEARAALLDVEAEVAEPPKLRSDHARILLRVVRARPGARAPHERREGPFAPADLLADVHAGPGPAPLPGDGVRALLSLDDLSPELPGRERRLDSLARRGVACTGAVVDGRLAVIDPATGIRAAVERLRRRISRAIFARLGTGPDAGLVAALSVGDRSGISPEQNERFSASGLAHVVSISGMHLGLIVLGAFRLLAWLLGRTPVGLRFDPRRLAALACLPLVPAYTLLAGADPPVVRAAFAAAAALLATAASRVAAPGPVLAAAALGCLALDPACLVDLSFQLSFSACAGLVLLNDGLRDLVPVPRPPPGAPRWRRAVEALLLTVVTTVAATLATLPLTALYFGRVSLAAIPANAVAVPVGSLLTAVAAVAGLVAGVSPTVAALPLYVAQPLALLLDGLAAHFASWPLSRIALPTPTMVECLAAWAAAGLLAAIPRAPRAAGLGLVAAVALAVVPRAMAAGGDGRLRIDFLPVGQGDGTLLRLPGGGTMLVDACGDLQGKRDIGALRVVAHLADRGVMSLDVLVITHLHPDHAGGAPSVLRALPVKEVWTGPGVLDGYVGEPLARAIEEAGAARRVLFRGDVIEREGVRFEVLGPGPRSPSFHENDGSLVLRAVHGEVAVLLPGDIEAPAEAELLAEGSPVAARLVKAPHHGSATSSTAPFVRAVAAEHVVFPVGRRNLFGFPSADVAARWEAAGTRTHRTDRGPVDFASDGVRLQLVRSGVSPRRRSLHRRAGVAVGRDGFRRARPGRGPGPPAPGAATRGRRTPPGRRPWPGDRTAGPGGTAAPRGGAPPPIGSAPPGAGSGRRAPPAPRGPHRPAGSPAAPRTAPPSPGRRGWCRSPPRERWREAPGPRARSPGRWSPLPGGASPGYSEGGGPSAWRNAAHRSRAGAPPLPRPGHGLRPPGRAPPAAPFGPR